MAEPRLMLPHFAASQRARVMGIESLSDESVLRFYEKIRQQLDANLASGNRRFLGQATKQRAHQLHEEIERRRLRCNPTEWR